MAKFLASVAVFFLLPSWTLFSDQSIGPTLQKILPAESRRVVQRIIQKNIRNYETYKGIESLCVTDVTVSDAETGEIEEAERAKYIQKSYFYEVSETEVLEYTKNGEAADLDDYDKDDRQPAYQIFDGKSLERFDINVVGITMMKGQRCYRLQVVPKQNTDRHFKGTVFVNVDSLNTVYLEGTVADYPFGLKKMKMVFSFQPLGELSVFTEATVDLLIHVPIIKPNTRVLIRTVTLENKPIPAD